MKITIYKDDNKEWRWRLRARNGRILADSGEGYKRKAALMRTLDLIHFEFGSSDIEELK